MDSFATLQAGDPAPWFIQRTSSNPSFNFDTVAGRYIVLCYFGSAADGHAQAALAAVGEQEQIFDDEFASFFGVSIDPADEKEARVEDSYPGYRYFWDFDGVIAERYGAIPENGAPDMQTLRRSWFVLDPTMRLIAAIPFAEDRSDIAEVIDCLKRLPPPDRFAGFEIQAPILILPRVFEPAFCRQLIDLYEGDGGEESGFMLQQGSRTVHATDDSHKRRRDWTIEDPDLIRQTQQLMLRRVVPEIYKVHQFQATRMERYLVGCYSAEDGGHFAPHRDNTTSGTAHRRFAVSINLNDDFEGGEVGFPEYGPRRYKAPPGGAVVFSCSLLHSVSRVTRGRRYAFLPFLYDDAAAALREENEKYLSVGVRRAAKSATARR